MIMTTVIGLRRAKSVGFMLLGIGVRAEFSLLQPVTTAFYEAGGARSINPVRLVARTFSPDFTPMS